MTVTVGTDVYDVIANVDTYWSDRANTAWGVLSTASKEAYCRKAAEWLDRNFKWRGSRATDAQRLQWPRLNAYDDDGFAIGATDAPWQVKEAAAIIADLYRGGVVDLEGVVSNSGLVKRQKVDVVEIEYETQMRGQATVSHVYQLLRPVCMGTELLRS
jgi:hypothetical protein